MTGLTPALAQRFATIALSHVTREYPNKLDHVLTAAEDAKGPRALHPIFYGSFDWHSCVHGYWLLARTLRRFPDLAARGEIEAVVSAHVTDDNVAAERAYLARPSARGFERWYGWGWLLALETELEGATSPALRAAAAALSPLAADFAKRFADFLPLCDYPTRTGVHSSTSFALRLAADYAETRTPALYALIAEKARAWYGADRDAQAWEPSQDDFLSPTLMEAALMARLLDRDAFRAWFDAFLPHAALRRPAPLFAPARVSDRSDGKIAHLDGLNFSRAWCFHELAAALSDEHAAAAPMREAARAHVEASLPHVAGDYMGEHWLATFAILALDGV